MEIYVMKWEMKKVVNGNVEYESMNVYVNWRIKKGGNYE